MSTGSPESPRPAPEGVKGTGEQADRWHAFTALELQIIAAGLDAFTIISYEYYHETLTLRAEIRESFKGQGPPR